MEHSGRTAERLRLLANCAAKARALAPQLCAQAVAGDDGCAWYHGFWPYLRLLDYGSSPELHKGFYLDGLAPLAASAEPRVLISGAADFAMLEVAREAFTGATRAPRFTVVDRCDTPLALCRWFAAQQGFEIETCAADILGFEAAPGDSMGGFDAIVTHSFLGNFPPEARPGLARRWHALLRPGGRLLTINRLRGSGAAAAVPFSQDETQAFVRRLLGDLGRYRSLLDCAPEEIAALAEPYLSRKRSFPVKTREELAALLEDAGFAIDCLADLAGADPGAPRPTGPTMPGGATYVKVIARRKA